MDFEVKMQGGEPLSTMKVSESEGRLEGLATAVTPTRTAATAAVGVESAAAAAAAAEVAVPKAGSTVITWKMCMAT